MQQVGGFNQDLYPFIYEAQIASRSNIKDERQKQSSDLPQNTQKRNMAGT